MLTKESGPAALNVLLWFWGREGAGAKFSFELARELRRVPGLNLVISCARDAELQALMLSELPEVPTESVTTFYGSKGGWRGRIHAALALRRLPTNALRFRRILSRYRIDVALCVQNSVWDAATLYALRYGSTRFMFIMHDATVHPGDEYPFRNKIMQQQRACADGIITLSQYVKTQITTATRIPEDRVWLMPHGTFSYSRDAAPAIHPRGVRPFRLLFFGRIVVYKGLERLLSAYQTLLAGGRRVELTIAGSGSLKPYQAGLQAPGITVYNRWLSDQEIADQVAASDLVVLPYSEASQSGVAATAYTAGRPVVATPIGGLVDQVRHEQTGLVTSDMTPDSLAHAIARLMDDPELFDRCAAEALRHAQQDLSWARCAALVADALQTVCSLPKRC